MINLHLPDLHWVLPNSVQTAAKHPMTYLHELGHAIAMKVVYDEVTPSIWVNERGGGYCRAENWNHRFSWVGRKISPRISGALVNAGGPIADLVGITLLNRTASLLSRINPFCALAVKTAQCAHIVKMFSYAMSCQWRDTLYPDNPPSGDYSRFKAKLNWPDLVIPAALTAIALFAIFQPQVGLLSLAIEALPTNQFIDLIDNFSLSTQTLATLVDYVANNALLTVALTTTLMIADQIKSLVDWIFLKPEEHANYHARFPSRSFLGPIPLASYHQPEVRSAVEKIHHRMALSQQEIEALQQLVRLDILPEHSGWYSRERDLVILLQHCPNLRTVEISSSSLCSSTTLQTIQEYCPDLTSLKITGGSYSPEDLQELLAGSRIRHLTLKDHPDLSNGILNGLTPRIDHLAIKGGAWGNPNSAAPENIWQRRGLELLKVPSNVQTKLLQGQALSRLIVRSARSGLPLTEYLNYLNSLALTEVGHLHWRSELTPPIPPEDEEVPLPWLKGIDLNFGNHDEIVNLLTRMPNLSRLGLMNVNGLSGKDFSQVAQLCPRLRNLTLMDCELEEQEGEERAIHLFEQLRSIDALFSSAESSRLFVEDFLPAVPQLASLTIDSRSENGEEELVKIANGNPRLRELNYFNDLNCYSQRASTSLTSEHFTHLNRASFFPEIPDQIVEGCPRLQRLVVEERFGGLAASSESEAA